MNKIILCLLAVGFTHVLAYQYGVKHGIESTPEPKPQIVWISEQQARELESIMFILTVDSTVKKQKGDPSLIYRNLKGEECTVKEITETVCLQENNSFSKFKVYTERNKDSFDKMRSVLQNIIFNMGGIDEFIEYARQNKK